MRRGTFPSPSLSLIKIKLSSAGSEARKQDVGGGWGGRGKQAVVEGAGKELEILNLHTNKHNIAVKERYVGR